MEAPASRRQELESISLRLWKLSQLEAKLRQHAPFFKRRREGTIRFEIIACNTSAEGPPFMSKIACEYRNNYSHGMSYFRCQ